MNDLRYQNEENIKQVNLRNGDIKDLMMQMDALNMTIDTKDEQIEQLKDSVLQAEIKARKTLEKLNKATSGEAQNSIDQAMTMLSKVPPDRKQRQ